MPGTHPIHLGASELAWQKRSPLRHGGRCGKIAFITGKGAIGVIAVEFKITGRVQGVGFRYFTLRAAAKLGLFGWVRNEADGSVLCRAAGAAEQIESLRQKLRQGPPFGRTDDIVETPLSEDDAARLTRFSIDV